MIDKITALFCLLFWPLFIAAQNTTSIDSTGLDKKAREIRKEQRQLAREQFSQQFIISLYAANAFINSSIRFEGPNSILSAQIDLEKHLGLSDNKMVYNGIFIYRITPRSGINVMYYKLNRRRDHILDRDIIFLGDTLKKGQVIGGYLNTSIVSFGYLLSILTEDKAFFGAFVNIYIAKITAGVNSELFNLRRSARYNAATPNFGIVASFELKKWLSISGGIGIFFMNTRYWSATFHDLQIMANLYPTKWLGLSIGYQVFDVKGSFPEEKFTTYINYNIRGPAVGLKFRF